MENLRATPSPAGAVPRERADWRRLGRAVRRLESAMRLAHARARDGSPPRVLIVDDDAGQRMLCAISLQCEGFVVLEAVDGVRGLELARAERPDLILTDVVMPRFDGFQLAEALRCDERTSRIPVIFLSGETGALNGARARELGAVAYVSKPFDPSVLASLVAGALTGTGTDTRGAGAVSAEHPAA